MDFKLFSVFLSQVLVEQVNKVFRTINRRYQERKDSIKLLLGY